MAIIVSGASGDLGTRITRLLLEKTDPSDLILLSRSPEKLAWASARGAEVRQADFDDVDNLTKALQGGHVFMVISTLSIGKRVSQHSHAFEAAKRAGVPHVVYTSSMGIQPQTPSLSGQEHYASEQALFATGLKFTILRNSWYADVIPTLMMKPSIDAGAFVASTGDGSVAAVSKDDCANAAACVLANADKHENAIYEITGPELLTFTDIARLCSEAAGKETPYVNVSHDEKLAIFDSMGVNRDYEEGMMNDNTNAWASNEMITYEMAIKQLYFSICSRHVELITGQAAKPLAQVIQDYREAWA
jgi:NAD(P)H dehydrogenase (quinone)